MQALQTATDNMGKRTDVLVASSSRLAVALVAGTPKAVPVPAGARTVVFAATGNFWVAYDASAQLPTADVLTGDAPELNPAARVVERVTVLGLVAPAACMVSLAFYG